MGLEMLEYNPHSIFVFGESRIVHFIPGLDLVCRCQLYTELKIAQSMLTYRKSSRTQDQALTQEAVIHQL